MGEAVALDADFFDLRGACAGMAGADCGGRCAACIEDEVGSVKRGG